MTHDNPDCGSCNAAFAPSLSVGVLSYHAHETLARTLASYEKGALASCAKEACIYWIGQFIGGILAGAVLLALVNIVTPSAEGIAEGMMGLGCNGVANAGGVWGACLVEIIATFIFVLVVLGTTDSKLGAGNLAGLAIGLTLILVHLVCINLTGTSVNPARSFGPALFAGGQALADVWVFIVAPMIGAALSALVWKGLACNKE